MDMNSNRFKMLIEQAKSASKRSDYRKYKLGCVIFDKQKVYSVGFNLNKSSPIQRKYDRYRGFRVGMDFADSHCWNHNVHAEIHALITLLKTRHGNLPNFGRLSILVYREDRFGGYALAKPCPACEAMIREVGIKNVYYTGNGSICHELFE